jgi:hypothetical protein
MANPGPSLSHSNPRLASDLRIFFICFPWRSSMKFVLKILLKADPIAFLENLLTKLELIVSRDETRVMDLNSF